MNEESPVQLSAETDSSAIADHTRKKLEFRDIRKYPYKGMDIKDLVSIRNFQTYTATNFPNAFSTSPRKILVRGQFSLQNKQFCQNVIFRNCIVIKYHHKHLFQQCQTSITNRKTENLRTQNFYRSNFQRVFCFCLTFKDFSPNLGQESI